MLTLFLDTLYAFFKMAKEDQRAGQMHGLYGASGSNHFRKTLWTFNMCVRGCNLWIACSWVTCKSNTTDDQRFTFGRILSHPAECDGVPWMETPKEQLLLQGNRCCFGSSNHVHVQFSPWHSTFWHLGWNHLWSSDMITLEGLFDGIIETINDTFPWQGENHEGTLLLLKFSTFITPVEQLAKELNHVHYVENVRKYSCLSSHPITDCWFPLDDTDSCETYLGRVLANTCNTLFLIILLEWNLLDKHVPDHKHSKPTTIQSQYKIDK
jgi:hypothetical protein